MAEKIKMLALQSFVGIEGMVRNGHEFEAEGQKRAEELEHYKLAKRAGEAAEEPGEGLKKVELQETIEAANSHAKLDAIIEELGLENIPSKEDGAKLDERKAAVLEAL